MAEGKSGRTRQSRAIVVAFRTVIYAVGVFFFEFGERLARGWYHTGTLHDGLAAVKVESNLGHFLALLILVCTIVAIYLAMERLARPVTATVSTRCSRPTAFRAMER
jgi:hypothetical protein